MRANDVGLSQRRLVNRRIHLGDAERITKYVLPFVTKGWSVPFTVVDLFGQGPRILEAPVRRDGEAVRADAKPSDLKPIESVPRDAFSELVHFDPWRVFRGIGGVDRAWVDAIVATNIARPFSHEGKTYKVDDLAFRADGRVLDTILAKDDLFHGRAFRKGEIDFLALRRPPPR